MREEKLDARPDVSVVVPCHNGASTLRAQLSALADQQTRASFEVLLCDNGSTDGSAAVVGEYDERFRVVEAGEVRGINHARNRGISASAAPLLLFCDADDRVHPGWLEAYWRAFGDGAALMGGSLRRVAGASTAEEEDTPDVVWQHGLNDYLGFLPWATGANCGLARTVVDACGPFDETYRGGGDETEFFWRAQLAGFGLRFVGDAAIDYVRRPSSAGVYRQNRDFGRSHVRLFVQFRQHGMRRRFGAQMTGALGRTVVRLARSRGSARHRRALVAQLGILAGHARQSVSSRSLYV